MPPNSSRVMSAVRAPSRAARKRRHHAGRSSADDHDIEARHAPGEAIATILRARWPRRRPCRNQIAILWDDGGVRASQGRGGASKSSSTRHDCARTRTWSATPGLLSEGPRWHGSARAAVGRHPRQADTPWHAGADGSLEPGGDDLTRSARRRCRARAGRADTWLPRAGVSVRRRGRLGCGSWPSPRPAGPTCG